MQVDVDPLASFKRLLPIFIEALEAGFSYDEAKKFAFSEEYGVAYQSPTPIEERSK